jgi:starvation-inducible DNA-binding protein
LKKFNPRLIRPATAAGQSLRPVELARREIMSATQNPVIEVPLAVVEGPVREKNHQVLQPLLTDLIAYSLIVKQLHWNVVGPHFRSIHLFLDEIHESAEEAVDLVAERLSATGHSPNGQASDLKESEIGEVPRGFLRDAEVLLYAAHRTKQVSEFIRSRTAEIEEIDTVTADLLHQLSATFEKHHWMLQAQRS